MNKGFVRKLALLSLMLILTVPTAVAMGDGALKENGNGAGGSEAAPAFKEVSVHDPSIVKDGDTYYVFGTHIEAAKSKDLMSWTTFTNGYATPGNAIYGDLSRNLAHSFAWAGEDDSDSKGGYAVWAPDVFYNKDYVNEDGTKGAYMIYYSASSTYIRSAIGFAVSQSIEGPYTYGDTVVYSGFTEEEAYDANSDVNKKWTNTNIPSLIEQGLLQGENGNWFNEDGSYNNRDYPNAIDPMLLTDKNGKLWMTYGSWSGGIFLLPIDPATGKAIYPGEDAMTEDGRMVDRYFGTKLAGGYFKSGEGPYIVYNKDTDYYYLFETYGWLGADGGYNMRTFRSKNPDGPYVDAAGHNAVLPGDVDHAAYGNKVMGNFLFKREVGDPGEGIGFGYLSPGHNSVYADPDTGTMLLVFHSRFPQRGETHEVRIHQLFMNRDGWPVAAPYRYTGETPEKADRRDIIGEYKFINHGKTISGELIESAYVTLEANNKVSGDAQGTWKITAHNEAELTIGGETYKGVFVRGWDPMAERYVMTFTAMSEQGVAIWGSRQEDKTDRQIVDDVIADLSIDNADSVAANLALPTEGMRHAAISWTSSNPDIVSESGVVTRPESDEGEAKVTLTASVTKGAVTASKSFAVTVKPYVNAELIAAYPFEGNLDEATGSLEAGTVTGDRIDNAGGAISYTEGVKGQAARFDGASGVRLPDGLIAGDSYSVSLWVKPEQLTTYTTAFFGARDINNWVSLVPKGSVGDDTMVWSGSETWYDGVTGMTIPVGEWSHLAFSVDEGTLKVYVNGELKFTGANLRDIFTTDNGTFGLGVNWWDAPFKGELDELHVFAGELTPRQLAELANP